MKIAVIGSGISGLSAAYYLSKNHKVDLFEKDNHFGGHSYTLDLNLKNFKDDVVGEKSSQSKKERKTFFKDTNGKLIPVMAKASRGKGETVYDARLGEVLFNISSSDE